MWLNSKHWTGLPPNGANKGNGERIVKSLWFKHRKRPKQMEERVTHTIHFSQKSFALVYRVVFATQWKLWTTTNGWIFILNTCSHPFWAGHIIIIGTSEEHQVKPSWSKFISLYWYGIRHTLRVYIYMYIYIYIHIYRVNMYIMHSVYIYIYTLYTRIHLQTSPDFVPQELQLEAQIASLQRQVDASQVTVAPRFLLQQKGADFNMAAIR